MAALTERIKLGTLLTPPSRRRPWKLASELVTLDMVSDGRAMLCAGSARSKPVSPQVGEETDRKQRAELMDEMSGAVATVLDRQAVRVPWRALRRQLDRTDGETLPVQQPRIPIWNVG